MMDFRDFSYVQAIAKYKTISKAAEMLYISQPSLTKFLQKLEQQIGTPLFERINKHMTPTYAGQVYLNAGRQIFMVNDQLKASLQQIINQNEGVLKIGITTGRCHYVMPIVLPLFKDKYPHFHLEILVRSVPELEQALADGSVDLAVYSLPYRNSNFSYIHVNKEEVVLCLPSNHSYKGLTITRPNFKYPWLDLRHLDGETFFIDDPVQWRIGEISQELIAEAGIQTDQIVMRNIDTCLALASSGSGYTFCFDICVKCFRDYTVRPCYLSTGNSPHNSEFLIGYRKGYLLSPAQQYFVNLIQDKFGENSTYEFLKSPK